jgi:hypothetical protein
MTERGDTAAGSGGRRALPTFNGKGTSFPVWKARVRAWLQAESPPLLYVLDTTTTTTTMADATSSPNGGGKAARAKEERHELDRQRVYNALISSLDDTHVGIIVTEVAEGDAQGAWKILLRKYERNTAASRNQLRRELHTLRLGDTEGVDEYKARALHISSRLRAAKEVVSDGEVLFCLLEGLTPAYDMVRQALEVQDVVDLEAACSHLREVEDKVRRRGVGAKSAAAQLNKMTTGGPSRPCLVCRENGHYTWACPKRRTSGCYRCGSQSHVVRECQGPVEFTDPSVSVMEDYDGHDEEPAEKRRPATPGWGHRD